MAITLRMIVLMSSIKSHIVFRKWIIMKFFALLCNLARWCWWWQLRFTKRTSNHLWWSWIASIWAEFGWATVCGRSHMHLRRLPTAFCLSPRLIIVADVQLLANPPCSRGNNDDRGGCRWSWRFGSKTAFVEDFTQIFTKRSLSLYSFLRRAYIYEDISFSQI